MFQLVSRVTILMTVFSWCYGAIDINRTILANNPDIVLLDHGLERRAVLADVTIPHDASLVKAEKDKLATKYLQVCDRNSVDVNDCMVEAVTNGIQTMAGGIEDVGVPGVDPYHQKELKVQYNNNQISAKMNLKDIYVKGLKGATVRDARVKADDDRFHMEIDLEAPEITINGTYVGEGQYNALKLDAYGSFVTTMTGLVWTWKLDGIPEKNGSDTFVRINSFEMRPDVQNMVSRLENNNPDSKALTDLGNDFLKGHWRVLYKELLPFAQANWNRSGIRISNKIFLKIPYLELFPVSS